MSGFIYVDAITNSPVDENETWFQVFFCTTSWYLCSSSSLMFDGSSPIPNCDRSDIMTERIIPSVQLTSRSRPFPARRITLITRLQIRVEWIIWHVCVSMMLIHPFDVPAMMWFPKAVKTASHVYCFASWVACFAAAAGSSPSCGRRGADGKRRLMGVEFETSTRTGWSSNNTATKRRLLQNQGC